VAGVAPEKSPKSSSRDVNANDVSAPEIFKLGRYGQDTIKRAHGGARKAYVIVDYKNRAALFFD
jgi:hypothetical protein